MGKESEQIKFTIEFWKPTPNQATFGLENGTYRGTIVFSSLRGFVSGEELLDDPEIPARLVDALQRESLDGPCKEALRRRVQEELDKKISSQESSMNEVAPRVLGSCSFVPGG